MMICLSIPFIFIKIIQFQMVSADLLNGQIELRLQNFSQFANGPIGTEMWSTAKHIRGLTWQLKAVIQEQNEKKFLDCSIVAGGADSHWNCAAEAIVDISVGENKILTKNFHGFVDFNSIKRWKFGEEMDKLLEHCQSSQHDEVVLNANVKPDPPCGRCFLLTDVLIVKENEFDAGNPVKINKKVLALNSLFFNRLFFASQEGSSSSSAVVSYQPVVQLEPPSMNYQPVVQLDPPSTLMHFRQLILLLHFGDGILNDANVEAILRLANRFLIEEAQGRCARFLLGPHCKMTKLKRFHIAHEYGLRITKNLILNWMNRDDFSDGKTFMEQHKEMQMLGKEAEDEFVGRYHQLFPEAHESGEKRQKIGHSQAASK